jgi:hypothetical protein
MAQLVEESRSAWRIKTSYEQDAANCDESLKFWKKLLEEKQAHIDELERIIRLSMEQRESDKVPNLLEK